MKIEKMIRETVLLNDLDKLKSLIESDYAINFKDKLGRTILHDAVIEGYISIVDFICENKIDINAQDNLGKSALHFGAIYRHTVICEILIKNVANIDIQDNNGNTPLFDAIFNCQGKTDLINIFILNKADFEIKNNYGVSPKDLAENISNFDITHLFRK